MEYRAGKLLQIQVIWTLRLKSHLSKSNSRLLNARVFQDFLKKKNYSTHGVKKRHSASLKYLTPRWSLRRSLSLMLNIMKDGANLVEEIYDQCRINAYKKKVFGSCKSGDFVSVKNFPSNLITINISSHVMILSNKIYRNMEKSMAEQ